MRTIETNILVTDEGQITLNIPLPPGEYHVVLVVDDQPIPTTVRPPLVLPVIHIEKWPENLSLRREDMYGDDER